MRTTMYFDGACPLCLRGVRHWRRLDWARRLEWVDLTRNPDALAAEGIDFVQAMQTLHVRARDGRLLSGAHAFAAIWAELPGYRWLAWLLSPAWAMSAAERLYRVATAGRRARTCERAGCALPSPAQAESASGARRAR